MTETLRHTAFGEPKTLSLTGDAVDRERRFAELVQRQSRFALRVAYSVLRNVQDSEDAVQETFLKLYRTGRWEGMDDERAFLARAAWRSAIDRLPRCRLTEMDPRVPSNTVDPERAAIAANWSATVHRLIDALPEELRQPLALSAVDDLKSHEIAAIMRIPEGTVRSRLSRARQVLKQKLGALMAGAHGR